MISIKHKGNFKNIERFLSQASKIDCRHILEKYGEKGVLALSSATPIDSGETANSWKYSIEIDDRSSKVVWSNTNIEGGVNVAILIQYGHATISGGYVQGLDFINPALKSILDEMSDEVWREVSRL
jgi:hypothetical protein